MSDFPQKAYIYDHVRTPRGRGKKDGTLHQLTALELARQALVALRDRSKLDTALIDDCILGCVMPVGEQGANIARTAVLAADYAQSVAGFQLNRFCASGLEAVNVAAAKIMSGEALVAIGGGVEAMSRVPMGSDGGAWPVDPFAAFKTYFVPQGVSADAIATRYGFSRGALDAYALRSHQLSAKAWKVGRFSSSVITMRDQMGAALLAHDEAIRESTSLEGLGGLNPSFAMMGEMGFDAVIQQRYPDMERVLHVHTPGNSSAIVDGAGLVLLGSEQAGKMMGLRPRARILGMASIGSEPSIMLTGPAPVSEKLLKKLGMSTKDIDLFEINEAFAAVVLRYIQALDLDPDRVNVNGGAIAMGHPLGATGAMILGTVLDELERTNTSTALITLCIGGGMGTATVIERL